MKSKIGYFLLISILSNAPLAQEKDKQPEENLSGYTVIRQASSGQEMRESARQFVEMQLRAQKLKLEVLTAPDSAIRFAKFTRAYYEALIAEGFTKREAMGLAIGIPGVQ